MNMLTVAICEESKYDIRFLQDEIKTLFPTAEIRIYENGDILAGDLERNDDLYDIIFLGLHEPGLYGMKTAKKMREQGIETPLVFVSDTDGYYKEAYDVSAFQYLELPLDRERLAGTFRMMKKLRLKRTEEKTVHFRYRSCAYNIRHSQIVYISSNLHNVQFHLASGKTILCRGKLNDFEEQLGGSVFLRCHQSFFVNMKKIVAMRNDSFLLGDAIVPISRSCAKEAKQIYMDFLEQKERET